jgi:hypothetical protein
MNRRSSWKTTLGGCLTSAGVALIAFGLAAPKIAYPWEIHAAYMTGFAFTILGPFINGLFGRDNGVSSEQAGAGITKPAAISKEETTGVKEIPK